MREEASLLLLTTKGHTSISVPKDLVERIERIIEGGKHGYRSKSEFVTDAVRRRIEELIAVLAAGLVLTLPAVLQLTECLDDLLMT